MTTLVYGFLDTGLWEHDSQNWMCVESARDQVSTVRVFGSDVQTATHCNSRSSDRLNKDIS